MVRFHCEQSRAKPPGNHLECLKRYPAYAGDECANASLPEPQGLGGNNSGVPCSVQGRPHSSAKGLLEGSEMEYRRTERIPSGLNGVGFDGKGFEQQPVYPCLILILY